MVAKTKTENFFSRSVTQKAVNSFSNWMLLMGTKYGTQCPVYLIKKLPTGREKKAEPATK